MTLTPEQAFAFTRWILADVAIRQDGNGRRPARGTRTQLKIQSIGILRRDTWGLCWQGTERGRGNDFSWRIALAYEALTRAGLACKEALCYIAEETGVVKHFHQSARKWRGCPADKNKDLVGRMNKVKVLIWKYQHSWAINWEREVEFWVGTFQAVCERNAEWYAQAESEYAKRIEEAREAVGVEHWLYFSNVIALADLYREQKKMKEAAELYDRSYYCVEGSGIGDCNKETMLEWIRTVREGPDIGPALVVRDGKLEIVPRTARQG